MPTEGEVGELISSLRLAVQKLEDVRTMVQHNRIQNERARDSNGRSPDTEDVPMFGDGMKPPYEVKKRRGVSCMSLSISVPPPRPRKRLAIGKMGIYSCLDANHIQTARRTPRSVPQLQ